MAFINLIDTRTVTEHKKVFKKIRFFNNFSRQTTVNTF